MTKISNDLVEAYKGVFEDDWQAKEAYKEYVKQAGGLAVPNFEYWLGDYVVGLIQESTPKRRLEVYLEWNGIIGYTGRIFEIATGEL